MTSRDGADDGSRGRLPADDVRRMFDAISPRYDLLNHLLSCGLDLLWRREAAVCVAAERPRRVLDVCTGTGDLAWAVRKRLAADGEVVGIDFSEAMIERARRKFADRPGMAFLVGDAMALPFEDGSFDAATCAFGLRNLPDEASGLAEMLRVVRSGGTVAVLEFHRPPGRLWAAIFGFYFHHALPIVGRAVSGDARAYSYLPASVDRFADASELVRTADRIGALAPRYCRLAGGVCALTVARKP